jgi:hypothetical protein
MTPAPITAACGPAVKQAASCPSGSQVDAAAPLAPTGGSPPPSGTADVAAGGTFGSLMACRLAAPGDSAQANREGDDARLPAASREGRDTSTEPLPV